MSALPSPLKSPAPAMIQLRFATVGSAGALATVAPFMSQSTFWPVELLRHRMSDLPLPLKSLTGSFVTTGGGGGGGGGVAPLETTRLTAEALATLVPAAGLSLITLPEATVVLDCCVTV